MGYIIVDVRSARGVSLRFESTSSPPPTLRMDDELFCKVLWEWRVKLFPCSQPYCCCPCVQILELPLVMSNPWRIPGSQTLTAGSDPQIRMLTVTGIPLSDRTQEGLSAWAERSSQDALAKTWEEHAFSLADSSCWGMEQWCRKLAVNFCKSLAWTCFEASDKVFWSWLFDYHNVWNFDSIWCLWRPCVYDSVPTYPQGQLTL